MKRSKRYREALEALDKTKAYPLEEALEVLEKFPVSKFDETVEVHLKLGVDSSKSDQQVRSTVDLPHGTGKSKRVVAITSTQVKEAKEAGADLVGEEGVVEKIAEGKESADILVATPEMMPKIAKFAKVLGPKGLMPNPKNQTVGPKVAPLVEGIKKGRASFKSDKSGNVHQAIGKRSFGKEKLVENFKVFLDTLEKNKPATSKGRFIKGVAIASTMSPGIKVAL
jgi:large subunit ribosomal protein L1